MDLKMFFIYLAIMAGVTYIIRALPFVLVKKKLKSKFIQSFLYYVPYAVLSAMTFPAIIYATNSMISAVVGFIVAVVLAYYNKSLIQVAMFACGAVLLMEIIV